MKKLVIILFLAFTSFLVKAQELNATVNVLIPQQVSSPPELFNTDVLYSELYTGLLLVTCKLPLNERLSTCCSMVI